MDQANDELLPGAALAVDEDCGVERRYSSSELEDVLHGLTASDEMFCRRLTVDALAKQVQLTLAAFQQALESIQLPSARAETPAAVSAS